MLTADQPECSLSRTHCAHTAHSVRTCVVTECVVEYQISSTVSQILFVQS